MENLKSGEVPELVSNIEVMHILSTRIQTRRQEEEDDEQQKQHNQQPPSSSTTTSSPISNKVRNGHGKHPKHGKLRHRDYIEEHVLSYLSYSPCAQTNLTQLSTLVSKLRRNKKKKKMKGRKQQQQQQQQKNNANSTNTAIKIEQQEQESMDVDKDNNNNNNDTIHIKNNNDEQQQQEEEEEEDTVPNFGFTDAEILQILNLMPTTPVEIHLMIEDLPNRLDEDEQCQLIDLIKSYSLSSGGVDEGEEGEVTGGGEGTEG